jgi:hypothetical protein
MESILTALVVLQFFVAIVAMVVLDLVTLNPRRYEFLPGLEAGMPVAFDDPEFVPMEAANDPVVHEAA